MADGKPWTEPTFMKQWDAMIREANSLLEGVEHGKWEDANNHLMNLHGRLDDMQMWIEGRRMKERKVDDDDDN